MQGRIHSIDSGGMLDGPGIRSVVFLSGCPMRCVYCHNPDTWDISAGGLIDHTDIVKKVLRIKPYFKNGGGITLSGGEPLCQAEFSAEILKDCKKHGIHTVLDTAGSIFNKQVEHLLIYTDLIILDIKHTNSEAFNHITNYNIDSCLQFLEYADKQNKEIVIRQVIVPGINDTADNVKELVVFCKKYMSVKSVELLPYHTMGIYKWERLGVEYKLAGTPACSAEKLNKLAYLVKTFPDNYLVIV